MYGWYKTVQILVMVTKLPDASSALPLRNANVTMLLFFIAPVTATKLSATYFVCRYVFGAGVGPFDCKYDGTIVGPLDEQTVGTSDGEQVGAALVGSTVGKSVGAEIG
jgi:hypothetical protein